MYVENEMIDSMELENDHEKGTFRYIYMHSAFASHVIVYTSMILITEKDFGPKPLFLLFIRTHSSSHVNTKRQEKPHTSQGRSLQLYFPGV